MENPEVIKNGDSHDLSSNCNFISKKLVGNHSTYVLHTAINSESNTSLAVALSNYSIQIFKGLEFNSSITLTGHENQITGVKFSHEQSNILFSSSLDGIVHVWDTRCEGLPVQSFSDTSDLSPKPFSCFDINCDEKFICTGTELIREDSFLIFWDRRSTRNLGGYWDSHTDDVTQVCFHPSKECRMTSGSVDGLINIFDLNEECEDDALLYTLNTESSVSKLRWKPGDSSRNSSDHIVCFSDMDEYQLWSCDEAQPLFSYAKEEFTSKTKCEMDYFIDSFLLGDNICIANGTKKGSLSLWLTQKNPVLLSTLKDEHKGIVRSLTWNAQNNVLITGGEDGLVCLWNLSLD